ncbi:MAG: gamma-glutamyltransferase, partial [Candidatus Latescibacteria bacterium]|nr:gamma-glutamyltransferase [bacterium]MBD3424861.1 gamma-glutamyltransferase [Candidatus Latescibacterota bacterium]
MVKRLVYIFLTLALIVLIAPAGAYAFAQDKLSEISKSCSGDGVVVTASEEATRVGVKVLEEGGTAVDAAIAVGFALAVTYPR